MYIGDCSALLLGASEDAGESSDDAGERPSISSSEVCRLLRMLSRRKTIEACHVAHTGGESRREAVREDEERRR